MILDIIDKKRLGKELSYRELDYFFNGYLDEFLKYPFLNKNIFFV